MSPPLYAVRPGTSETDISFLRHPVLQHMSAKEPGETKEKESLGRQLRGGDPKFDLWSSKREGGRGGDEEFFFFKQKHRHNRRHENQFTAGELTQHLGILG